MITSRPAPVATLSSIDNTGELTYLMDIPIAPVTASVSVPQPPTQQVNVTAMTQPLHTESLVPQQGLFRSSPAQQYPTIAIVRQVPTITNVTLQLNPTVNQLMPISDAYHQGQFRGGPPLMTVQYVTPICHTVQQPSNVITSLATTEHLTLQPASTTAPSSHLSTPDNQQPATQFVLGSMNSPIEVTFST